MARGLRAEPITQRGFFRVEEIIMDGEESRALCGLGRKMPDLRLLARHQVEAGFFGCAGNCVTFDDGEPLASIMRVLPCGMTGVRTRF